MTTMEVKRPKFVNALILLLIFTLVCGVVYPLVMTGVSQALFHKQAQGSVIEVDGVKYGSQHMGQQFIGNEYLWGRVMNLNTAAFADEDGNPLMYAGPSNLSPASKEFEALVAERVIKIREAHPEKGDTPIPQDLVTSSGSGLDPDISIAAANYQLERIAKERGISTEEVKAIIEKYTDGRFLGIMGEPTVNVLEVNLALDGILK